MAHMPKLRRIQGRYLVEGCAAAWPKPGRASVRVDQDGGPDAKPDPQHGGPAEGGD